MDLTRWWCFGGEISQELGEQKTTFTSFSISTIWRWSEEDRSVRLAIAHWRDSGTGRPRDELPSTPSTPRPGPPPRGRNMSLSTLITFVLSRVPSYHCYDHNHRNSFQSPDRKFLIEWFPPKLLAFSTCSRFRWFTTRVSSASWLNAHIRCENIP